MSIRLRPSSMLFWLLIVATAAINAFPSKSDAKGGLLPIFRDGKYGYIDRAGKVIVPPQFPHAMDFADGMARVALGEQEQWTYINVAGELMNKKFDKPIRFMDWFYNFSEGLAVARVGGAEQQTPDGYHSVVVGGKYGFIDKGGKVAIPVSFDGARLFKQGLAAVKKDAKWGFIAKTGRLAIPANFDAVNDFTDGLAQVMIQGKWGFINTKGQTVVQPTFDQVDYFHDGLAQIMLAGRYGFVDQRGHIVIEPKFEYAGNFSGERAMVRVGDSGKYKFGYIDKTGNMVIPAKFGEAYDFSEGLAAVKINREFQDVPDNSDKYWGYIDTTGAYVITPRYHQVHAFSEGLAAVSPTTLAPWGYIDRTGKMVIAPQFDSRTGPFQEGIACVYTDRDYKTRDDYGYIDRTGKFIWPFGSAMKNQPEAKAKWGAARR